MEQIKFKSGEYQSFTATRSFALGAFNVTVAKDSEVLFDGSTVEYAGAKYPFPQLRSAVSAEWLVLTSEYEEGNASYGRPVSANIKVRPPTDDGKSKPFETVITETDERVVMSSADHAKSTREQNKAKITGKRSGTTEVIEDQGGIPVRSLKTAADAGKTSLTAGSAGAAIRAAENIQIEPGKGVTEEEMLARMTPVDRKAYLNQKSTLRSRYVDADQQPVTVATIKTVQAKEQEGINLTQKVGGGIETVDLSGTGGSAKQSTLVEDGITFKNTNGPERTKPEPHPRSVKMPPMIQDGTVEVRVRMARTICPDFPDSYDFAASPKKKLARLQADFEDRPDIIKAVFVAESDEFKAKLLAEFPEAFQAH